MKKIEAVINRTAFEAVKLRLAEAGIEGRLTVTEVKGIKDLGRFYRIRTTASQDRLKPCLKIDLIVADREIESTVNIILRHAKLAGSSGNGGHINILPLDAALEIGAEKILPSSEEKAIAKGSTALAGCIPPKASRSESGQQTRVELWPTF